MSPLFDTTSQDDGPAKRRIWTTHGWSVYEIPEHKRCQAQVLEPSIHRSRCVMPGQLRPNGQRLCSQHWRSSIDAASRLPGVDSDQNLRELDYAIKMLHQGRTASAISAVRRTMLRLAQKTT